MDLNAVNGLPFSPETSRGVGVTAEVVSVSTNKLVAQERLKRYLGFSGPHGGTSVASHSLAQPYILNGVVGGHSNERVTKDATYQVADTWRAFFDRFGSPGRRLLNEVPPVQQWTDNQRQGFADTFAIGSAISAVVYRYFRERNTVWWDNQSLMTKAQFLLYAMIGGYFSGYAHGILMVGGTAGRALSFMLDPNYSSFVGVVAKMLNISYNDAIFKSIQPRFNVMAGHAKKMLQGEMRVVSDSRNWYGIKPNETQVNNTVSAIHAGAELVGLAQQKDAGSGYKNKTKPSDDATTPAVNNELRRRLKNDGGEGTSPLRGFMSITRQKHFGGLLLDAVNRYVDAHSQYISPLKITDSEANQIASWKLP